MSTLIEWCDDTWNCVTGCTKVSPGCGNCYAERVTERFHGKGSFDRIVLHHDRLDKPLHWRKPRRVFVNSMSDLFHDDVPDEYIARVFAVMAVTPQHTYQILTKRHARMRSLLTRMAAGDLLGETFEDQVARQQVGNVLFDERMGDSYFARVHANRRQTGRDPYERREFPSWPLPNVWLGVSVEDQKWADIRVPVLLDTPAAIRFLSCEPLLGPLDLRWCGGVDAIEKDWNEAMGAPHPLIDWVIVGGESGLASRPMRVDWARSLRDQCTTAGVPFFFKQWGGRTPKAGGRELDGRTWDQYPQIEAVTHG